MHEPQAKLYRSEGLGESLAVYLPVTAVTRVVGLGRVVLLVWLMKQGEFGLLSLSLLLINVAMPVCSLGLNEALARYVPQHEIRGTLRRFVTSGAMLVVAVAALLTLVVALCGGPLGKMVFASPIAADGSGTIASARLAGLVRISAAATFGLILYWLVGAVLRGLRMFKTLSLMELCSALLFAGLAVAATLAGWRQAEVLLQCYLTSLLIPAFVFGLFCARRLPRSDEQPISKSAGTKRVLFGYGIWIAAATVMWQLVQYWPMWLVNKAGGTEVTAVFAAVRQIGQLVIIAAGALTTVVAAAVTRKWEAEGRTTAEAQLQLAIKAMGLALLVICAGACLAKEWLIKLFPPNYAAGAEILPVLLGSFLMLGMITLLVTWFGLLERTRWVFAVYAVGVGCNALFGWLLIGGVSGCQQITWSTSLITSGSGNLLGAAAWTGMLAAACAAAMCLMLLRAVGRKMDVGTYLVFCGPLFLGLRWPFMLTGVVLLIVAAWCSAIILTAAERARLLSGLWGLIRSVRRNR